ncbi:MAG TPA: signal peptidase I [Acidobacteriota bacterium]|nr:signal peptidase I [Acidobacteriota bacterium]
MAKKKRKAEADAQQEGQEQKSKHGVFRENAVSLIICSIIAFFITTYVVHPMTVPTSSMEPTILVGDRVLVDKFTVRADFGMGVPGVPQHEIRRGDIVVFKHPVQTDVLWVKRVIGLPGEQVEVRGHQVFVDGLPLEEPYAQWSNPYSKSDFYGPVTVPPGSFFVMGDNRDNSQDSRSWGFLERKYLVGRPLITFWSYEDAPNAHQITGLGPRLKLYAERVFYFFPRTRWERMGRIIR